MSQEKTERKENPLSNQELCKKWTKEETELVFNTLGGKFNGVLKHVNRYEITIIPTQKGGKQEPLVLFKHAIIGFCEKKTWDRIEF